MCLNDRVMTALYKGEMSWADASEDKEPLVLNGWEDYAKTKNAWNKPVRSTSDFVCGKYR